MAFCFLSSIYSAIAICFIFYFRLGVADPSLKVVTNPRGGPFRVQQTVEFTCEVDLLPSGNITYQWKAIDNIHYGSSTYFGQSFNKTFYDYTLRFCWYFCSVTCNGNIVGKADKLIEVHGILYTNDSVSRAFMFNGNITLQINNLSSGYYNRLSHYIRSLTWYHNGTKIFPNDRIDIVDNETTLIISNMVESDAGIYEVKIGSIEFGRYRSSPLCDEAFLPVLENHALHAPFTFYVQKSLVQPHDPKVIINYYLPLNSATSQQNIVLNHSININTSTIFNDYSPSITYFYKEGVHVVGGYEVNTSYGDKITLSLKINYTNKEDTLGHYVYAEYAYYHNINYDLCSSYYRYLQNYHYYFFHYYPTVVFILYLNLQENNTPNFVSVSSSCPPNKDGIQADVLRFLSTNFNVSPLGLSREYAADSCEDIVGANPSSGNGTYWVRSNTTIEQKNCIFI